MGSVPAYSHIVVVIMENQNYSEIAGNTAQAPYINSLMAGGANLTNMSSLGYVDTTGGSNDFNHDPGVSFPEGYSVQTDSTSFPALFASGNYAGLPSVSFVIPSITNDMHSGTIQAADSWLQTNKSAYAQWAKANNSLRAVVWDEDDNDNDSEPSNQIPAVIYGANVVQGNYNTAYNDCNLTSTIMAARPNPLYTVLKSPGLTFTG